MAAGPVPHDHQLIRARTIMLAERQFSLPSRGAEDPALRGASHHASATRLQVGGFGGRGTAGYQRTPRLTELASSSSEGRSLTQDEGSPGGGRVDGRRPRPRIPSDGKSGEVYHRPMSDSEVVVGWLIGWSGDSTLRRDGRCLLRGTESVS